MRLKIQWSSYFIYFLWLSVICYNFVECRRNRKARKRAKAEAAALNAQNAQYQNDQYNPIPNGRFRQSSNTASSTTKHVRFAQLPNTPQARFENAPNRNNGLSPYKQMETFSNDLNKHVELIKAFLHIVDSGNPPGADGPMINLKSAPRHGEELLRYFARDKQKFLRNKPYRIAFPEVKDVAKQLLQKAYMLDKEHIWLEANLKSNVFAKKIRKLLKDLVKATALTRKFINRMERYDRKNNYNHNNRYKYEANEQTNGQANWQEPPIRRRS